MMTEEFRIEGNEPWSPEERELLRAAFSSSRKGRAGERIVFYKKTVRSPYTFQSGTRLEDFRTHYHTSFEYGIIWGERHVQYACSMPGSDEWASFLRDVSCLIPYRDWEERQDEERAYRRRMALECRAFARRMGAAINELHGE